MAYVNRIGQVLFLITKIILALKFYKVKFMGTVKRNLIIEGQSAAKHPNGMKVQRLNGYWVLIAVS